MRYTVGWLDTASVWHTASYAVWTDAIGQVLWLQRAPGVDHDSVASWLEEVMPAWHSHAAQHPTSGRGA